MKKIAWVCDNGCDEPTSGCVLFEDGELWADGCCGGGCVIVQINYCPVCGLKVQEGDLL